MKSNRSLILGIIGISLLFLLYKFGVLESLFDENTSEYEYYDNGNLKRATLFSKSDKITCYQYYYENGTIFKKYCKDENGLLQGPFEEYFLNGNKKETSESLNNEVHGLSTTYYENAQLKDSAVFDQGLRHGFFYYFTKQGLLKTINYFDDDILIHKRVYEFNNEDTIGYYETYNPIISLNKDSLYFGVTLTITFETPLSADYEYSRNKIGIAFDFEPLPTTDENTSTYPNIEDTIKGGYLKRSFIIEDSGNHQLYGF